MLTLRFTPAQFALTVGLYLILAMALAVGAYHAGRSSTTAAPCCDRQHANDLLRVGFRIVDPEGFDVREFDD